MRVPNQAEEGGLEAGKVTDSQNRIGVARADEIPKAAIPSNLPRACAAPR